MMAGDSLRKPVWDLSKLPRFEKAFYKEHPIVTAKSEVRSSTNSNSTVFTFSVVNTRNQLSVQFI